MFSFLTNLLTKNQENLEKKQALPFSMAPLSSGLQASWHAHDFYHFCTQGYRKNPIVYSCVRMTADGAAHIPLKLYKNKQEIADHPAHSLINRPNPMQSGYAFRAELFGYLQLSGNSYIHILSTKQGRGQAKELHILRPDRVRVMTDDMGYVHAYAYDTGQAHAKKHLMRQHIMHLKYFSPDDDYYGQAPLAAAMRSNETHNSATEFQKSLLDNAARPSGCLVYSGGEGAPNLTMEQIESLKTELESHYTGPNRAGRPMILDGGLDWKPMSFSPSDMEFSALRHNTARDIALAFGVPPMMLGIPGDNTYSNYQEAVKVFTRNCLIPMANKLAEALSCSLSDAFNEDLTVKVDSDHLPAFLPEREAHRHFIASADFLSDNEKRELLLK